LATDADPECVSPESARSGALGIERFRHGSGGTCGFLNIRSPEAYRAAHSFRLRSGAQVARCIVVLVVHKPCEVLAAAAHQPALVVGTTIGELLTEHGKAQAVVGEHRLVAVHHQSVGLKRAHIERHRAGHLGGIDDESSANGTGATSQAIEVEAGAVGPMRRLKGHEHGVAIDRCLERVVPICAAASVPGQPAPRQPGQGRRTDPALALPVRRSRPA
jgi:hypothetical protein